MLLDYCLISILLLLGHLLRSQWRLLQYIYLPSSIIAGFLGLIGGDQFLAILPFDHQESGELSLAAYPSLLISILFATLFMGGSKEPLRVREMLNRAGDTFFYNLASEVGQYAIALLFGLAVLAPLFPELNPGFSLLLPAAFVGGHGTVTAMAQPLLANGWSEALTIGYTFATVGMLSGIVGGMLLVNLGAKRGWTRLVGAADQLPESLRKGFVPVDERRSVGQETVSPIALDPLAWHIALVLTAYGIAQFAHAYLLEASDNLAFPLFALALLAGAALQKGLDAVGLGGYVDRSLMERIGSTLSDYLVAFGVASISMRVVVDHAVPLLIMSVLGIVYSAALPWLLGRRMFRNFWFERSLFVYGWNTGTVGIGIALLRVVDPRQRSRTLADFGFAYLGISFVAITIIVGLPELVVRGYIAAPAISLGAAFLLCLFLSRYLFGWYSGPPDRIRPGEEQSDELLSGRGAS